MKKKVLSAIVCAAMVFSMTACGLQSQIQVETAAEQQMQKHQHLMRPQHQMREKQKQQLRQHPQGTAQQNRSDRRSHWFMQRLTR